MEQIKINTRDFGEIEVKKDSILTFTDGLFAFENLHRFVIISPLGKDTYPMWLQSVESVEPCFIVYDPVAVDSSYNPCPSDEDLKLVDYKAGDELSYLAIAVIPEDFKKATINLKSPVLVNNTKHLAAQIILDQEYSLKSPVFSDKGGN